MRKVELDQGSPKWHEWREGGIGASDAAAILGKSPWKTAYQLWLQKMGKLASPSSSFAMERGNRLEDEARQWFNFNNNVDMVAACYEDHELPFLRVSLDGINPDETEILEIKCPGKKDHHKASCGEVPEKYIPQVQMQLYVTRAKKAHYLSYDGENAVVVEVYPDEAYQTYLIEEISEFWNCLRCGVPPALEERDCLLIDDDMMLQESAIQWRYAKERYEKAKKDLDFWKNKIIDCSDDGNIMGYGVKLKRVCREGSCDYEKLLDDLVQKDFITEEVLENRKKEYRKPQIGNWQVLEDKKCLKL